MNSEQFKNWMLSANSNNWQKPLIMGVLNVTPDSFFDGGLYLLADKACARAQEMIAQGADIIDIGGESTRPGARTVNVEEELARVIPVIKQLRQMTSHCISIDTSKPLVMDAAISAGADMINDINALQAESALQTVAALDVPICLMHMQANPQKMQDNPSYPLGVMAELNIFFKERIMACMDAGIETSRLILDPGFGFGKRVEDNLLLINQIEQLLDFKLPLLLGVSRKSSIGSILLKEVNERMTGSIVTAIYAVLKGVGIIRTHDVNETNQAFTMLQAIQNVG